MDSIADNLTGINNAYSDQNSPKTKIDKSLIQLISRYNEDEEPLRKEEQYLKAIKYFEGDKEAARQSIIRTEQERQQKTLNLVEQMSSVILTDKDTSPSERKTAVSFLSGYIRKGFKTYITEKKEAFPNQVTLNVDGWVGTSADGNNAEELCRNFENAMTQRRADELQRASRSKEKIMLIGTGVLLFLSFREKKAVTERINAIEQDYARRIINGKAKINHTAAQWKLILIMILTNLS